MKMYTCKTTAMTNLLNSSIRILLLSGYFFLLLFSFSCAELSKKEKAYEGFQSGFENANKVINNGCLDQINNLTIKSQDPPSKERAGYWLPKAQLVQAYIDTVIKYIENLKARYTTNILCATLCPWWLKPLNSSTLQLINQSPTFVAEYGQVPINPVWCDSPVAAFLQWMVQ
jgi:hypothetical protein